MNESVKYLLAQLSASSPLNRLPEQHGSGVIISKPLIGVARGDDHIFEVFKEVVAPEHLTPVEMWSQNGLPTARGLATGLRVMSIVFPFSSHIREAGQARRASMPPEVYCVARNFAGPFIHAVVREVVRHLEEQGFRAASGMLSEVFEITARDDPYRVHSNWSERHVAFAAGLGTFSLHEALITEAGCNVRLASVITDAPLMVTPRTSDEPYANCLHYACGTCESCVERCPAGAISSAGHNKSKCMAYYRKVGQEMRARPLGKILKPLRQRINGEIRIRYPVGCALCQFGVPCMDKNPTTAM